MANYTGEQAFEHFIDKLAEHIKNPEALNIEAQYRLNDLSELVQGEDWIQDGNGNVFPASLPQSEQQQITETCAYCIIDEIPKIVEGYPSEVDFAAIGSLISGVTIIVNCPNTAKLSLQFDNSEIVESRLVVG